MKQIDEYFSEDAGFFIKPGCKLFEDDSGMQKIEVYDTCTYGRVLRIGNYFQTSERDEFLYHEPLVQTAMFSREKISRVLVIGGGDGGALKEVLKHDVEEAWLVEIDKRVVQVSRQYLGKVNQGCFDDPRVRLVFEDGLKFIERKNEKFDVIILDLTDPLKEAKKLYTKEFYGLVKKLLCEGGVVSLHAEYPLVWPDVFGRIIHTLESVFKDVKISYSFVPIYGTMMSFACCSDAPVCFRDKDVRGLRLIDKETYHALSATPPYIREILSRKQRIITSDDPLDEIEGGFNNERK